MTFEERMDELAKGQQDLQQSEMRLSNALNHLVEVQAQTEYMLRQALEAIARLANTARAQNETIAEHDTNPGASPRTVLPH